MRFTFGFSLIATVVFAVAYWYVNTSGICPVPIFYKVGEVDQRFPVTSDEVKLLLLEAEEVWEEAVGRDLFQYNENTEFSVNLIYDERQKDASTEETWRIELDAKEEEVSQAARVVEGMQSEYETIRRAYEDRRTRYESELASYNSEVDDINASGGANKEQYDTLEEKKTSLNKELKGLVELETELNTLGLKVNEKGEYANLLVEAYNAEVTRYNSVYGERSEIFTQGDYERERINVYTFSTKRELTQVLAHEFGHALGIGHVDGGQSLMYYLMADQPEELTLSLEDKETLLATCGAEDNIASTVRRAIRTALSYL